MRLSGRQMTALMLVYVKYPIRTSRIADMMGINTSSALNAIKTLELKGQVARHARYTYSNDISWTLPGLEND